MRYPKEHKEQVRERLLQASARHAKAHGLAVSGVDALAGAAGVTSGALYKHFDGKTDLFGALMEAELSRTAQRFAGIDAGDRPAIDKALRAYLSLRHVRHPDEGCALPSLTPEVARSSGAVRDAFDAGLADIQHEIARLSGSSQAGWTVLALCVGAVMLSRASADPRTQRELLEAAEADVRRLLDAGAAS
jgi:AcrR family transcriptional regulator